MAGGFAQFVRAMPWIAERGMVAIPDDVSFEEATFIEPVNTCLKAVGKARVAAGRTRISDWRGAIGLLLMMLAAGGRHYLCSDPMAERRTKASHSAREKLLIRLREVCG